jgi:diadenosine tetraphosphatase ApaH/serine/threonine PP2A family protein phosphatase
LFGIIGQRNFRQAVFLGHLHREEAEQQDDILSAIAERPDAFYCHGSPLSDVESFGPGPGDADERLLAGVKERQVVFGHSHLQFRRPGPNETELVNPGSVGMPLDGDIRAAWAVRRDDGGLELRRTPYDVERAVAKMREYDWGERVAQRLLNGRDPI